jgi:hypothetical protein
MNDEKIRILDPIWGEPVFGSRDHEPGSGTQGTGSGNRDPDFILDPQDWYVMKKYSVMALDFCKIIKKKNRISFGADFLFSFFYNKRKTRILLNFYNMRIRNPG